MTNKAIAPPGSSCVTDASTRSFCPKPASQTPQQKEESKELYELPPIDPQADGYEWFPMYVLYRQNLKVEEELKKHQFETFIPMETVSMRRNGKDTKVRVPAVHNLIFVYSTMKRISWMKMFNETGAKMQYMSRVSHWDGSSQVITVPQRQMDNIIRAATAEDPDGLRSYIDTPTSFDPAKPGRKIMFVGGPFEGIEGIITRVHKNKVMLIDLPNSKSIQLKITRAQDINYL